MRIFDVRTDEEYFGERVRARRAGALPGAVHLDWVNNVAASGAFKEPSELRAAFERLGLSPEAEIVPYCQGGYRSANAYYALRLAGYNRVRNYIGSWVNGETAKTCRSNIRAANEARIAPARANRSSRPRVRRVAAERVRSVRWRAQQSVIGSCRMLDGRENGGLGQGGKIAGQHAARGARDRRGDPAISSARRARTRAGRRACRDIAGEGRNQPGRAPRRTRARRRRGRNAGGARRRGRAVRAASAARDTARSKRRGIPAALSLSAGAYVCNAVMYATLHTLRARPEVAAAIHLPYARDQAARHRQAPSMTLEMMAAAVEAAAGTIARAPQAPARLPPPQA